MSISSYEMKDGTLALLRRVHGKMTCVGVSPADGSAPQTNPADWTVTDIQRTEAQYDSRVDLVSFTFSYQGGPAERLEAIPMERGITEEQICNWLANVQVDPGKGLFAGVAERPLTTASSPRPR